MTARKIKPKIDLEITASDRFVEALGFIAVIFLTGIPAFYYGELPQTIPLHYGFDGQPDGLSNKGMIWLLPGTGIIIYAGLFILSRFPHKFNYAVTITEENAERQYKIAVKMVRVLNTLVAGLMCYSVFSIVQTSPGNQNGPGSAFTIIFNVLIFGTVIFFMVRSFRNK